MTVECNDVRLRLQPFLDSTLAVEETEAVETHLGECEECWTALSAHRDLKPDMGLSGLSQNYRLAPLPDDFTDQVMQRVHDERPKGVNLVWPWLRRKWSRRQYASVAYAMSATLVVVSAGNVLFLWNESTSLLTTWGIKMQAYGQAFGAYRGAAGDYLALFWHGLLTLLHIG